MNRIPTLITLAALALALPASGATMKNKLDVVPVVLRTYVKMAAFYDIAPDSGMDSLCAPGAPLDGTRMCADYVNERARITLTMRRVGKIIYDETGTGVHGTWEQRVRFRALRDEAGRRCSPGLYYWTVVMPDPVLRDSGSQAVARRGRFKLKCEDGQLVATP
jgi:hypothetical protein